MLWFFCLSFCPSILQLISLKQNVKETVNLRRGVSFPHPYLQVSVGCVSLWLALCDLARTRCSVRTHWTDHFCNGILKFVCQVKRCSPITGKNQGCIRVAKVKVLWSDSIVVPSFLNWKAVKKNFSCGITVQELLCV